MAAISITPNLTIPESTLQWEFVRASGPGGQNVNKVSSATVLRFHAHEAGLPPVVLHRLSHLAGSRMNAAGVLILKGQQFRTQERNREDVLQRLVELLREAATIPVVRRATKPTRGSKIRTLEAKKRRGQIKQNRRGGWDSGS